ncbi:hypothetical protein [Corallococcus macrosporus]|nr:hypothetical protein [Corallococcus macrosporus]
MTSPEWLEHAARRSKSESWMLGHAFEEYRQLEGLSEEALAKELGCSEETLRWLALCRCPEGATFDEQVSAIAERHGVDDLLLVQLLRRLEVVKAFKKPPADGSLPQRVLLMAAQDREREGEENT